MSLSLFQELADAEPEHRARVLRALPLEMQADIPRMPWWLMCRPEQNEPGGAWRIWLIMAGRGFGKTRTGAETVAGWARRYPGARIALIAITFGDGRDTMVEGDSGLLSVLRDEELRGGRRESAWNRSMGELFLANGTVFKIYSSEKPRQLRGPQHHFCFPPGTMVATPSGDVPIESLAVGDLVSTRFGPRPVEATMQRMASEITTVIHERGQLTGTPDHPVLTDRGWTALGEVRPGDTLFTCGDEQTRDTSSGPRGAGRSPSTAKSGRPRTARSQLACISTTVTRIARTIGSRIWSSSRRASIAASTLRARWSSSAKTVGARSSRAGQAVGAGSATDATNGGEMPGAHSWNVNAGTADGSSPAGGVAPSVVSAVSTSALDTPVVNLTVADVHEFVAAGVVVHNCWGDEPSYWTDVGKGTAKDSTFSNANIGLRLPARKGWDKRYRPRMVLTCTPRRVPLMKMPDDIVAEQPHMAGLTQRRDVVMTRGSSLDNLHNLDQDYRNAVIDPMIGTTLGRQELGGEMLEDVEGALWQQAVLDRDRVVEPPDLHRAVVAMDPAGGSGIGHDEHGIIGMGYAGHRRDPHFYVLHDRSLNGTPTQAARAAVLLYYEMDATALVYEKNQGGEWIPTVIESTWATMCRESKPDGTPLIDGPLPNLEPVVASKGKRTRAEPIAALSMQKRMHMVGTLPILEGQLTTWVPDETPDSPDRLDAMVWAGTWLYEQGPGIAEVASAAQRERRGRRPGQPSARLPVTFGARAAR